jgi:ABC-type multidrug transport system ATPase subunit
VRVELKDVRKSFGRVEALRGVSAELAAGERVALIGPNGSGKSTLLRAILGLIRCDGTVRIDGRSPYSDRTALAFKLAYVPQVAPRIGAPVRELVRAAATVRGQEPADVAQIAGRLGLDLEAIAGRPFQDLSGGMKQKVLIALALAAPAALLVLDEPTASLDTESRGLFFELLEEIRPGATVLLCSHRLEEIRSVTPRVWALTEGRLVWTGSCDALHTEAPAHPLRGEPIPSLRRLSPVLAALEGVIR